MTDSPEQVANELQMFASRDTAEIVEVTGKGSRTILDLLKERDALREERRGASLFVGLLLQRLGGSVTFSNKEIEAADLEEIVRRDTLDEVTYEIRPTQREPR